MSVENYTQRSHIFNALIIAACLWAMMFSPYLESSLSFWWMMSISATILIGLAIWHGRDLWKELFEEFKSRSARYWLTQLGLGIGLAIVLWGVFWAGDKLSQWLFPAFARTQVNSIYSIKEGFDPRLVSTLLLLLIGPSEEIFWRGYLQERLQRLFPDRTWLGALIAIGAYTAIHIASLNFMLIVAAAVCGLIWGGLYWYKREWFPALILSHALWDATIFVWLPV